MSDIVTASDREAVLRYWNDGPAFAGTDAHAASVEDTHPLVQAFARHRIATTSLEATRIAKLEEALEAVIEATGRYLPPDGISAKECISLVLEATDNPTVNAARFVGKDTSDVA